MQSIRQFCENVCLSDVCCPSSVLRTKKYDNGTNKIMAYCYGAMPTCQLFGAVSKHTRKSETPKNYSVTFHHHYKQNNVFRLVITAGCSW